MPGLITTPHAYAARERSGGSFRYAYRGARREDAGLPARLRLHDGARSAAATIRSPRRSDASSARRASSMRARCLDDGRPRRHAQAGCPTTSVCRAANQQFQDRRRRGRVHARHARRATPGRALHQDHGIGWRRIAHGSHLDEPVPRGRDPRDRERVHRAAHLRLRALPPGERRTPLRGIRRALHRAWHAHR